MGRRKKEDTTDMIYCNGSLAPAPQRDIDNLAQMSIEARNKHMSYGQLQAQKFSEQIDFSIGVTLKDQLKTVREILEEKEEAAKTDRKPAKGRSKTKK